MHSMKQKVMACMAVMLLSGCSMSVKEVRLPILSSSPGLSGNEKVVLTTVVDDRNLDRQQNASSLTNAQKSGLIVAGTSSEFFVLSGGTSVADETRLLVTHALEMDGFVVVSDAPPDVPRISVEIKDFSGVVVTNNTTDNISDVAQGVGIPLLLPSTMDATIVTVVNIYSNLNPLRKQNYNLISGNGKNPYLLFNTENWSIAFQRAVVNYEKNFHESVSPTLRDISKLAKRSIDDDMCKANPVNPAPTSYPPQAVASQEQGQVLILGTLDKDGVVDVVRVYESSKHPLLDDAALAEAQQWTFPASCGGKEFLTPVNFSLHKSVSGR